MMNNEAYKSLMESVTMFITAYETGYKTIEKGNPDKDFDEVATMTEIWWKGFCGVIAEMGKGGDV